MEKLSHKQITWRSGMKLITYSLIIITLLIICGCNNLGSSLSKTAQLATRTDELVKTEIFNDNYLKEVTGIAYGELLAYSTDTMWGTDWGPHYGTTNLSEPVYTGNIGATRVVKWYPNDGLGNFTTSFLVSELPYYSYTICTTDIPRTGVCTI